VHELFSDGARPTLGRYRGHTQLLGPAKESNRAAAGAKEIVVFASATEAFSKKNQNCTVEQALEGARAVVVRAKKHNI
jgi:hydroxymethylglutaryl-CoA lyase